MRQWQWLAPANQYDLALTLSQKSGKFEQKGFDKVYDNNKNRLPMCQKGYMACGPLAQLIGSQEEKYTKKRPPCGRLGPGILVSISQAPETLFPNLAGNSVSVSIF